MIVVRAIRQGYTTNWRFRRLVVVVFAVIPHTSFPRILSEILSDTR